MGPMIDRPSVHRLPAIKAIAVAAFFACASWRGAWAATTTVYGITDTNIYSVNTSTGAATSVYSFSSSLKQAAASAQRASDGIIFFLDYNSSSNTTTVYSWNPATPSSAPLTLGTTGNSLYLPRLAFGPDGLLYAMDQNATEIYLISQTTGAATAHGAVSGIGGTYGGDIAFGPTGTLYVGAGTTLYTMSPTGGTATSLGSVSIGGGDTINGLAFDSTGRLLIANSATPTRIYAITLPSLTTTNVGSAGGSIALGDLASIVASDLQITSAHTGYFIAQGPAASYTLQPKNGGNGATSGTITVVDTLPAGLTYGSASGTGWTCGDAGQTVTCTTSTAISANSNGNPITLGVTAATSAIPSVTNAVSLAGGNEPALYNGNDTGTDLTYVGGLSVVKSANKTQVNPNDTVVYTLTYTNNNPSSGGSVFKSIVISDTTPSKTTFVSAACNTPLPSSLTSCTVSAPAVGATGTVTWTFAGSLAVGGSGSVTLTVKVQ
jgi:uncharacterized repeat protein (TIGR01451 family)